MQLQETGYQFGSDKRIGIYRSSVPCGSFNPAPTATAGSRDLRRRDPQGGAPSGLNESHPYLEEPKPLYPPFMVTNSATALLREAWFAR